MSLRPGVDANTAARAMTPLGATAAAARFDAAALAPTAMARLRLVLAAGRQAETGGLVTKTLEKKFNDLMSAVPGGEPTADTFNSSFIDNVFELLGKFGSSISKQKKERLRLVLNKVIDKLRKPPQTPLRLTRRASSSTYMALSTLPEVGDLCDDEYARVIDPRVAPVTPKQREDAEIDRQACRAAEAISKGSFFLWLLSFLFG